MTETLAVNQVAPITSVPQGWQTLPLRRIFRITGGATPKSDVAEYWDGEINWVTPADLGKTSSLKVHNSARTLTRAGLDSCAAELLPPGSIIVSVRAPIGAIGIAKVPMATNQGCKGLVGQSADSKFMAYQLSVSQASLEAVGRGTTFTELSATDLGSFQVAVPPPDLQRTIANFLDRETAKIDALIDKQEQLIATLREDRAATITHAVTKGLNPVVEMKDPNVEWADEVPADWQITPFLRCMEGRVDYRGATPQKVDAGTTLITARNVRPGLIDYAVSEEYVSADDYAEIMRRGLPEIDDILLTMEAPLGHVALVDRTDVALAQRIIKFRADRNIATPKFLMYSVMNSGFQFQLKARATGSTALGLKASKLPELQVAIPSSDEQEAITHFLDDRCAKIDALIDKSAEMIETLREYRSALITNAVTGKIDVREAV